MQGIFDVTNAYGFRLDSTGDEVFFRAVLTQVQLLSDELHDHLPSRMSLKYFSKELSEIRTRIDQGDPGKDDMLLLGIGYLAVQQVSPY